MASTPLYKRLKQKGTSFYAFSNSSEHISSAYQNPNFKMYFSKYVLLDLPTKNLVSGTNSNPIYFDFDNSFFKSNLSSPSTDYADELIESLRNYVANHEVVVKESRLNNTDFYYDNTDISTPTEKIFWKWCKKLNLMDLEPASPTDEYFGNLDEFSRNNLTDDEFFNEFLWREREVNLFTIVSYREATNPSFTGQLEIEILETSNFKVGDIIIFSEETNYTSGIFTPSSSPISDINGIRAVVELVIPKTISTNEKVILNLLAPGLSLLTGNTGKINLVYHRLVQYVGEVNGVNNVSEANESYTEIWAHIPAHTGQTPDVLFRTKTDKNYKPGLRFPILPSQIQSEIIGGENFTNPLVSTPQNYPGTQFGQFDDNLYTYRASDGDSLRRSGDYFGYFGDINNVTIESSNLDGLSLDFNTNHYVKMNSLGSEITNFDQFNALVIGNEPPKDFQFNAILWYYTVEDVNGDSTENLYGISFLGNPNDNPIPSEFGIRVPAYNKLVASDSQDGTSYQFSLNLNFLISNENPQDLFNPEAINSLFSFNLYNEAMRKLSSVNSSFLNILISQSQLSEEVENLKQLVYTQTDIDTINKKLTFFEELLKLYQTNQIASSPTISASNVIVDGKSFTVLESRDAKYGKVDLVTTTNMFSNTGNVPIELNVPNNKDYLIKILNDDTNNITLPNSQRLTLILDRDLDKNQSVDIIIDANDKSTENKQLDIFIRNRGVLTPIFENLDLPIYYNPFISNLNSAKKWKQIDFNIDLNRDIILNSDYTLELPLQENGNLVFNSIVQGDVFIIENFTIGTSDINFSGQYEVLSVGATNSYIYLDVSSNQNIVGYSFISFPEILNDNSNYLLSNKPYLRLNKGYEIKLVRISDTISNITNTYDISIEIK
jgi:hypothetical protein